MVYAVIMAGGVGSRFWPLSTPRLPKQLLNLFGDKTMIELTSERILPLVPLENQRIVTIEDQVELTKSRAPQFTNKHFVIEPFARNTAACIGLSAVHLMVEDPDAVMIMLPADHLIQDVRAFRDCLTIGIQRVMETDSIVTLGIEPTRPETGYGYIQYENDEIQAGLHRVVTFAEKPNREMAEKFINTGEFLWNSGIFLWSARRILSEIEEFLPGLFAALVEIQNALGKKDSNLRIKRAYQTLKPISIDYGVMEHARNINVLKGNFDWSDVGNWAEVWRLKNHDEHENVIQGSAFVHETERSYVYSNGRIPVAVMGMRDVIVVSTDDGVIVCPRDMAQEVRRAAEAVEKTGEGQ